jgi:hypothetical protein
MASLQADDTPEVGTTPSISESSSTILSNSVNSTPASTVDTLINDHTAKVFTSQATETSQNDAETPRESRDHAESLSDQFENIQAKLAHIQQEHDRERAERYRLEHILTEEVLPLASTIYPILDEEHMKVHRRRRPPFGWLGMDYPDESARSPYLHKAIKTYERGLDRLKKENDLIEKLYEERQNLEASQLEWHLERETLLAEKTRLQLAFGQLPNTEASSKLPSSEVADDSEAAAAPVPEHEVPELNYVEWTMFKAASALGARSPYAIDVLDGEPALTFQNPNLRHLRPYLISQEPIKPRRSPKPPVGQHTKQTYDGQSPLPERIRINSKHIKKILEGINDDVFSGDGPWIMIRPYKALIYYGDQIRHKLEELEQKYVDTDPKQSSPVSPRLNESDGEHIEQTVSPPLQTDRDEKTTPVEDEFTSSLMTLLHLRCLDEFITCYLNKKMSHLASDQCRTVSFADIWHLFKPGEEVVEQSRRQAYRIISVTSPGHRVIAPWERTWRKDPEEQEDAAMIHCVHVDFDGKQLGPVSKQVPIARFEGEKAVTSLAVFPLRFADGRRVLEKQENANRPATTTLRERLVSRGRTFLDVTTFKHMYYSGLTETRDEIDSHVVVDFVEAFSPNVHPTWRPELEYLIDSTPKEPDQKACGAECCRDSGTILSDAFVDRKRNAEYMAQLVPDDQHKEPSPAITPRLLEDIKNQPDSLSENDLVIMSDRVCGFVLHSRRWGT